MIVALQPRPTAWVTGGGALPTGSHHDLAKRRRRGRRRRRLAGQAWTTTPPRLTATRVSDGDEGAWAAADGLDEDHRALRVQGLAWDGIPQSRRRRVWLELSGASKRAGDPTVPPPELLGLTEGRLRIE